MYISDFYIMNASCLFGNCAATFAESIECWDGEDATVLVCRRQNGPDKYTPIFIHGAHSNYIPKDAELPYRTTYTEDTGNGYKNVGKQIYIDNVIQIKDGKITMRNVEGIGCKKRRVWVFK